jgi:L-aminopeptidase/D-esterase-like protein
MKLNNTITDVPGIEVGQAQDDEALTGCTVILCRKGAVAGVDVRGGAPGTRETDLLNPSTLVQKVHAVMLAGGSAYGLDATSGVMRYLEEKNIGLDTGVAKVPIVPAAILFDLMVGRPDVRPDAEMGYRAASSASSDAPAEGNVGAGAGASVGKIYGPKSAMKTGVGTASINIGGVVIGAIVAVNAFGDVIDSSIGRIVAGARSNKKDIAPDDEGYFLDTLEVMKTLTGRMIFKVATKSNTVIGAIATDAKLTQAEATKVAQMAQDGLARTIRPAHTMLDGDTIFTLATGQKKSDPTTVGAFAAEVMAQAILRGARNSASAGNLPGLKV